LGNFEKRDLFHGAGFRTKILALGVFEVRFGGKQILPVVCTLATPVDVRFVPKADIRATR